MCITVCVGIIWCIIPYFRPFYASNRSLTICIMMSQTFHRVYVVHLDSRTYLYLFFWNICILIVTKHTLNGIILIELYLDTNSCKRIRNNTCKPLKLTTE